MNHYVALRVSKDYGYSGFTGLYKIQAQYSTDLNWHNIGAYYNDIDNANYIALALADLYKLPVYDLGGYDLRYTSRNRG